MLLKYVALFFQAVLPAAVTLWIGYLMEMSPAQWGWAEWLMAAPLIGFMGLVALLLVWKVLSLLRAAFARKQFLARES